MIAATTTPRAAEVRASSAGAPLCSSAARRALAAPRCPLRRGPAAPAAAPADGPAAAAAAAAPSPLASKRCEPCAAAAAAAGAAAALRLDEAAARARLERLEDGWRLLPDAEGRLQLKRRYRTKNFVKGLELFQRVGAVAEAEGHHPDLALEGWNNVTISLWSHELGGLAENDFIMAAKVDAVEKADLISKKPPLPLP